MFSTSTTLADADAIKRIAQYFVTTASNLSVYVMMLVGLKASAT
jgi:hypothetical protein